jgi:DNA-binding PadR family transcriptional regulator
MENTMLNVDFSNVDVRIASLAGQVLPVVQAHPTHAFAAEIARKIAGPSGSFWDLQNQVGTALNFLEQNGILTSEKVRHPDGHAARVRRYTPTSKGAFMISFTAALLPKAA